MSPRRQTRESVESLDDDADEAPSRGARKARTKRAKKKRYTSAPSEPAAEDVEHQAAEEMDVERAPPSRRPSRRRSSEERRSKSSQPSSTWKCSSSRLRSYACCSSANLLAALCVVMILLWPEGPLSRRTSAGSLAVRRMARHLCARCSHRRRPRHRHHRPHCRRHRATTLAAAAPTANPSPPPPIPRPPPTPPAPPAPPPRTLPPAVGADIQSLHELKEEDGTCGSSDDRNNNPSLCEQYYEWRMPANDASRCVYLEGGDSATLLATFTSPPPPSPPPQHTHCDSSKCRDINNDCCTMGDEKAACADGLLIDERGAGPFTYNGKTLHCPRTYSCCPPDASGDLPLRPRQSTVRPAPAIRGMIKAGCYASDAPQVIDPSKKQIPLVCHPMPPPAPPSPPPAPPPSQPPSQPPWDFMTPDRCEAMWADPHSRFHELWGRTGWRTRHLPGGEACWLDDGDKFFDDAWSGKTCQTRNWYTGNQGDLGNHKTLGRRTRQLVSILRKTRPHFLVSMNRLMITACRTVGATLEALAASDQLRTSKCEHPIIAWRADTLQYVQECRVADMRGERHLTRAER